MYHLSDRDLRCVQWLATKAKSPGRQPTHVFIAEIPKENGETQRDMIDLSQRLMLANLVGGGDTGSFFIKNSLLDLAHELNNPPPRNVWNEWSTWWLSKPLLVAVSVLIFVAPILAQWIEWIIALLTVLRK